MGKVYYICHYCYDLFDCKQKCIKSTMKLHFSGLYSEEEENPM